MYFVESRISEFGPTRVCIDNLSILEKIVSLRYSNIFQSVKVIQLLIYDFADKIFFHTFGKFLRVEPYKHSVNTESGLFALGVQ